MDVTVTLGVIELLPFPLFLDLLELGEPSAALIVLGWIEAGGAVIQALEM